MPKEKAETVKPVKNRISNESTIKKVSSTTRIRPKNEEVKKAREASTDRNNIRRSTTIESKTNGSISARTNNITKPKILTRTSSISTNISKPVKPTQSTTNSLSSSRSNTASSLKSTALKGTKSSSRDITSKRVTKEQYFPKKYPFSSYLHENEDKKKDNNIESKQSTINKVTTEAKSKKMEKPENPVPKLTRERTMTRTLSPSEVKVIKNIVEDTKTAKKEDTNIERPRTATIRKHNETNSDNSSTINLETNSINSEDYEYEDDFESYESDFEEYISSNSTENSSTIESIQSVSDSDDTTLSDTETSDEKLPELLSSKRTNSAEEERKLDSGNYDLPDLKHKQILDNIKEAIEKENSNLGLQNDPGTSLASLSDEGFEDGAKFLINNNGFVNFMSAKKKQQKKKIKLKSRKRGEELMNMIRLNSVSFSLFDMEPISYEDFMKSYGKTGTIQVSSQTGDDDISEEVQTDTIEMTDRSTQFPVRFAKEEDSTHLGEQLKTDKEIEWLKNRYFETKKLNSFMEKAGKLILHLLEQQETKTQTLIKQNTSEIPFSEGYLAINFERTQFLKNRKITNMSFPKIQQLLTVHEMNTQIYMNQDEQLLSRATICIWNIFELNYPQHILVSSGEITSACFDSNHGYLIFASISDGSVCVWDLRESSTIHRSIYDEKSNETHIMRSASYTAMATVDAIKWNEKIVSIQSFYSEALKNEGHLISPQNVGGIQVCTLSELGVIVIWSVIQKQSTQGHSLDEQVLYPWSSVILVQGLVISLQKLNPKLQELQCFNLQLHSTDTNRLFIASNYGILHCLTSGMKPKPKIYQTEKSSTTCVEMAPFSPTYFLSGCENGNIKLHSRFYEKPLMSLQPLDEKSKIESSVELIEWSNIRPCVFFVKDSKNIIHIWDLMASDMFPIYSIPMKGDISDIKLSPNFNNNVPYYMAIGSKDYGVRLHRLSKEFCQLTPEQYKTELNTFLNYANRL